MTIRFAVLGEIRAHRDGGPVELGPARQRTVLAALLMDVNRTVPVEGLADRVWGARAPARPGPALYSYLSRLRQALDAGAEGVPAGTVPIRRPSIARRPGGYALVADADVVDVPHFRDLVARARVADDDLALPLYDRALGLWRGEPFAGVDTPWFNSVRETLYEQRHACRLDRHDLQLRRGRHTALLAELAACHEARPLDERLAAQFVLALHRSGRTADALRCFERVRRALATEVGGDPGHDLRRLHGQILAGDPAIGAPDSAPSRSATAGAPESRGPVASAGAPTASGAPGRPSEGAAAPSGDASGEGAAAPIGDAGERAVTVDRPAIRPGALREAVVPRQLPPTAAWFTGRGEELAVLDRALAPGARAGGPIAVCAVGGAGGVGKTSLALHWAHRNAHRFPQGQLYLDLRGFAPAGGPLAPSAALRLLVGALGVDPGSAPADQQALTGLYRTLLADRRVLIVLDDAADAEQVAALLPGGAGSAVLVTSRRWLTGLAVTHGAHLLSLEEFTPTESRDLLRRHLGEERLRTNPEWVAAVLEHCAGLPLAIGVAGARARTGAGLPLSALAGELRDESARLDALAAGGPSADVRTACQTSYRSLTERGAEVFRFLGAAPAPEIGLAAAASLLGRPPAATRAALRELEALHLVRQHAPGRYRMNELIRLYAAECPDEEGRSGRALRRVLDFYLRTAHAGHRLLHPHRPHLAELGPPPAGVAPQPLADRSAARSWFRAEHACLLAARQLADQRCWDSLASQLSSVLDVSGLWQDEFHDRAAAPDTGPAAAGRLGGGGAAHARAHHRGPTKPRARPGDRRTGVQHGRPGRVPAQEPAGAAGAAVFNGPAGFTGEERAHDLAAGARAPRPRAAPGRLWPCLA